MVSMLFSALESVEWMGGLGLRLFRGALPEVVVGALVLVKQTMLEGERVIGLIVKLCFFLLMGVPWL